MVHYRRKEATQSQPIHAGTGGIFQAMFTSVKRRLVKWLLEPLELLQWDPFG